jgi:SAM-dependent methyltransferase
VKELLDEQRRYYAARAPEYDDWWYKRGRYAVALDVLARWHEDIGEVYGALEAFGPRGSVLELAAGTGLWTRKLVLLADRVVAVDANRETLALNTDEAEHVLADIFEWRPAETFDVVFFGFWLSHVPEERFDDFWRTVRSALAPGGRVFLIDSGPLEVEPGDDRQVRKLADGREFRIVKKFWRPAELAERVRPLGFDLDLRLTANGNFLYGFGS